MVLSFASTWVNATLRSLMVNHQHVPGVVVVMKLRRVGSYILFVRPFFFWPRNTFVWLGSQQCPYGIFFFCFNIPSHSQPLLHSYTHSQTNFYTMHRAAKTSKFLKVLFRLFFAPPPPPLLLLLLLLLRPPN